MTPLVFAADTHIQPLRWFPCKYKES